MYLSHTQSSLIHISLSPSIHALSISPSRRRSGISLIFCALFVKYGATEHDLTVRHLYSCRLLFEYEYERDTFVPILFILLDSFQVIVQSFHSSSTAPSLGDIASQS